MTVGAASEAAPATDVAPARYATQVVYATFTRRFWALVLDLLILLIGIGSISAITNGNHAQALGLLFAVIYVLGLTAEGGTIGKRLLQLRVVRRDNGARIGLVRAMLRELIGRPLSELSLGLGFLWMLDDNDRQTWHDHIASSIVVREISARPGPDWRLAPPWRRPLPVAAVEAEPAPVTVVVPVATAPHDATDSSPDDTDSQSPSE